MTSRLHSVNEAHSGMDRIRVVLADGHATLRHSLRTVLDSEEGVTVVAEAEDMATLLRQLHEHRPDVLVLDIRMPIGSIFERIDHLRTQAPGTQIVVITMHEQELLAEQALGAGAMGFVLKDTAEVELGDAVRSAARCVPYTSPRLAGRTSRSGRARSRG